MKILLFLLFSFALSLNLLGQNKEAQKKFDKEITTYFRNENIEKTELPNKETDDKIFKLIIDNSFYGYAILATAKGRMDSFDFMMIYNSKTEVELIKILIYRSQYGQEITNKNWLKQFYKKSGLLTYGKDVQAISGATLSAKSITGKINDLTILVTKQTKN